MLPQNILPVGERVEEDKNIYISQETYKEIREFTKNKTVNESGGMLIGNVIEEFGKTNIVIHGFVEAKYSEGTSTTLKFTHETWEYVHGEIDKKYENAQIVGWIHTHRILVFSYRNMINLSNKTSLRKIIRLRMWSILFRILKAFIFGLTKR